MYHRSLSGDIWAPGPEAAWEGITGDFYLKHPPAASWGPNRLDVFMAADPDVDGDANVWHRWWDGTAWNPDPNL